MRGSANDKDLIMYIDGACSGNPGQAGIGVFIVRDGQCVKEISQSIGEATNNTAEYSALIRALEEAHRMKAERLKIITDSELLYKQVLGKYKVKNEQLTVLFQKVKHLAQGFAHLEITHVLREQNKDADRLATAAIPRKKDSAALPFVEGHGENVFKR